jgi:hypothetical protein
MAQSLPTTSNASSEPVLTASQRVLSKSDLVATLAAALEKKESYGTLAAFALADRHVQFVVQPVLAKVKKRIVLVIEDYRWRDPANDGSIR